MVFNRIVSAAVQHLGYLRPPVFYKPMHQKKNPLFLAAPVYLLYPWIEVVVPPFATLLAHAAGQMVRDCGPLLRAVLLHQLKYFPVFFLRPGTFNQSLAHFCSARG